MKELEHLDLIVEVEVRLHSVCEFHYVVSLVRYGSAILIYNIVPVRRASYTINFIILGS